jgi:heat shock protein HslJ
MFVHALPRFAGPLLLALLCTSGCQTRSSGDEQAAPAMNGQAADRSAVAGERLLALPVETSWTLSKASAAGLDRPEAGAVTLRIAPKRLSGNSGCNNYSAGFHMDEGGKLSVGQPAATKRGCPGAVGAIEQALFAVLPQLDSASMDADALVLSTADGATLRFVPAKTEP